MNQILGPQIQISTLFNSLIGQWSINRRIVDTFNKNTANATGTASFKKETQLNELIYNEEVELKWSNVEEKCNATKQYKYILNNDVLTQFNIVQETNNINYEKMYDLKFILKNGKFKAKGDFLCGKDMYKATYEIEDFNKFTINYDVKGISKNYSAFTIFNKIL